MKYSPRLLESLTTRLQQPLPGIEAHLQMAPPLFQKHAKEGLKIKVPSDAKQAAVLVLLYLHEGKLHIPLMKRSEDGRVHGGQISLPGGRVEPTDTDYHATALREAHEEMRILPEDVQVLGSLSEIYIIPSNFQVFPTVGFMDKRPEFVADPVEVAEIIEVSVDVFLKEETRKIQAMRNAGGFTFDTPGYVVSDRHIVWGGTSMILAEFFSLVKEMIN
ncbi:MAG: CoA pyrophosphatase [Bacteroidota bacterium]